MNQLKKQGFKVATIAKKLEISRNTVYKYLDMTFDEATDWIVSLGRRHIHSFLSLNIDQHRLLYLSAIISFEN